jgi:hypothetical protein
MQLDVVVAADDAHTHLADVPDRRTVRALGEAKVGETIGLSHLARLDMARNALGPRAATARLLLFGSRFNEALHTAAANRPEVELIDLERIYGGE